MHHLRLGHTPCRRRHAMSAGCGAALKDLTWSFTHRMEKPHSGVRPVGSRRRAGRLRGDGGPRVARRYGAPGERIGAEIETWIRTRFAIEILKPAIFGTPLRPNSVLSISKVVSNRVAVDAPFFII